MTDQDSGDQSAPETTDAEAANNEKTSDELFDEIDTNNNGHISKTELREHMGGQDSGEPLGEGAETESDLPTETETSPEEDVSEDKAESSDEPANEDGIDPAEDEDPIVIDEVDENVVSVSEPEEAPKVPFGGVDYPLYDCHKQVRAFKIGAIASYGEGKGWKISPANHDLTPIAVTEAFYDRHQPQVGDMVVYYVDGYMSVSPAQAFEDGYRLA